MRMDLPAPLAATNELQAHVPCFTRVLGISIWANKLCKQAPSTAEPFPQPRFVKIY